MGLGVSGGTWSERSSPLSAHRIVAAASAAPVVDDHDTELGHSFVRIRRKHVFSLDLVALGATEEAAKLGRLVRPRSESSVRDMCHSIYHALCFGQRLAEPSDPQPMHLARGVRLLISTCPERSDLRIHLGNSQPPRTHLSLNTLAAVSRLRTYRTFEA